MSTPEHGPPSAALLEELRSTAPPAPDRLRARIEQLAATEPARPPSFRDRLSLRRALVVAAPTALAGILAVAVVHGISTATRATPETAAPTKTRAFEDLQPEAGAASSSPTRREPATQPPASADTLEASGGAHTSALPPAKGRAQDYRASLTVRVGSLDALSDATKDAIRMTRGWGGYVVSADYDAPGREGESHLELRVPIRSVQTAIQKLSELGTLAAQDISIRDVQAQLDRRTREILSLRERIADLRVRLAEPGLDESERARLELQLARSQKAIANLRAERATLARRAAFAFVSLTLTTHEGAAAAPAEPGRIERAARDAASVLAKEVAFVLYALIVSAPFLLLAFLGVFAARASRRRADERLLGRA